MRIKYLDVAKFLGIFCIYLGHFPDSAGLAHGFVFTFHVPLFFFLSGCTETLSSNVSWTNHIKKTFVAILLPFYFFALVSLVFHCVQTNSYAEVSRSVEAILLGGVRNQFLNGTLWFLTCLFSTKLIFFALRKALKKKPLILLACAGMYLWAVLGMDPSPELHPSLPYNVDSALYYIIYYGIGYCCFDPIRRLFALDQPGKRWGFALSGLVAFAYSAMLFFGKDALGCLDVCRAAALLGSVLGPCVTIYSVLVASKLLEDVQLFERLGKETIYFCGSEHFMRALVPICLQIVGLSCTLTNPVATYIYAFALLLLCSKLLVPIEKACLKRCASLLRLG